MAAHFSIHSDMRDIIIPGKNHMFNRNVGGDGCNNSTANPNFTSQNHNEGAHQDNNFSLKGFLKGHIEIVAIVALTFLGFLAITLFVLYRHAIFGTSNDSKSVITSSPTPKSISSQASRTIPPLPRLSQSPLVP
ncbi:hypothetical protein COCSADRAFT_355105 [Bipolaris sorokiniana ND90Pr]|uniref:Uncharacterized protein n=1 Tax=Cochliobolus sativus (strain ND90Pr / ATCC 201652) TaxID=665912 RepID=M2SEQ7_COCSN|nr:uncharacterized protein COCSADRAFT_355105 [Bipolaris sorokiniana ND90Pr]EMD65773.1 hypothetical protein COCSADRAFT_355105 [Bipolaris sorokiniana ND90Pr]